MYKPPVGRGPASQKGFSAGPNREGGVPSTINCQVCNKMKPKDQYSNRQLLKYSSYNKGYIRNANSIKVTCTGCTASQTVELRCYICSVIKGLDGFAKNQRKDPDNARCIKCVDKVLDYEPEAEVEDSDEEESEDDENEDEDDWDAPEKASAGRGSPMKHVPKGKLGDSVYPESSASSQNGSSFSSSNHTTTSRSQAPPGQCRSNTLSSDVWETVPKTVPKPASQSRRYRGAPSIGEAAPRTTPTQPPSTKKNAWAKVKNLPKAQQARWGDCADNGTDDGTYDGADYGADDGADEWDKYGRNIHNQKVGKALKR